MSVVTSGSHVPVSVPRWQWAMAGTAAAAMVGAALTATDDGPVLCPFRLTTGGYCPGCGATRAAGRLLRGDVIDAWHHHPFVLLAAVQLLVLGALALALGSDRSRRRLRRYGNRFMMANLILLVTIWVIRLATGSIPIPFS